MMLTQIASDPLRRYVRRRSLADFGQARRRYWCRAYRARSQVYGLRREQCVIDIGKLVLGPERLQGCEDFQKILAAHRFDNERSEEHTSELQSLMRLSYAVFCLKKKKAQ